MVMKLSTIASKAARELRWGQDDPYVPTTDRHCMIGAIIHYRLGHEHCLKSTDDIPATDYYSHKTLKCSAKESEAISIDKIWQKNDYGEGWDFARFAKEFKKLGI